MSSLKVDNTSPSFGISLLPKDNTTYLDEMLLDQDGALRILPYSDLKNIPHVHLMKFCVEHGYYCIPTQELIDFLNEEIGQQKEKTIEVAAGSGVIAKALGIVATDSKMQLEPAVLSYYRLLKQTIVPYDKSVKVDRIDAAKAVRKYKPDIVVAAWLTHKYNKREHWREGNQQGVDEVNMFESINKYINIGNEVTHAKKPILELPHRTIKADWLLSRSAHADKNVIFIWEK
jgi:hypothetical protein